MPSLPHEKKYNLYALSVDIDWAPDYMIDYMAQAYTEAGVKCTWFVTHASEAVDRLRSNPLFELGIHPNFFSGSSHGATEDEIIRHVLQLVPGAKSVRMHALFQSSRLLYKLRHDYGLEVDSSLFVPQTPHLKPHTFGFSPTVSPLVRLPYFWEDDVECLLPVRNWDIQTPGFHFEGMKIFNFHPMYVGLNADTLEGYERIKRELCVSKSLNTLTPEEIAPYLNEAHGVNTLFKGLLSFLKNNNVETRTFSEIAASYR
jgi:hypothetical protein